MKSLITIFLCFFINCCSIFAQLDTTKMLTYYYDGDTGLWDLIESFEQEFSGEHLIKKEIKTYHYEEDSSFVKKHSTLLNNELGQPIFKIDSQLVGTSNGPLWLVVKDEYKYENGWLSMLSRYRKSGSNGMFFLDEFYEYFYTSEGLLEQKRQYNKSNTSENFYLQETRNYGYNENQCLIFEERIKSYQSYRFHYNRHENCNLLSESWEIRLDLGSSFTPYRKIVYAEFISGNNRIEVDSVFHPGGNDWYLDQIWERVYDVNNNLIRGGDSRTALSIWQGFFQWASFGLLGSDEIFYSYQNQIEYTNNNLISKKTQSIFYPPFGDTVSRNWQYEYYCNGNVKEEFYEYFLHSNPNQKNYFEYRIEDDCPEFNGNLSLTVFPNPSNGEITLQSDALQGSSSIVRVYSLLGQLIFEKPIPNQMNQISLSLSHLNRGNYIISVVGNGFYAAEKIVIK